MVHNWISATALTLLLPPAFSMQTRPLPPLSMGFSGQAYFGLEVKGKPYSARHESEQTFSWPGADKPTHTSAWARIYRDSQGRTRIEQPVFQLFGEDRELPLVIEILDPVAGCQYTLDTENHVAHRVKTVPFPSMGEGQLTPERAALLRMFTRNPPPPPPPPPPPGSKAAERLEQTQESASITFEPRTSGNTTEENLGTKRIEGVMAEGHRSITRMLTGKDDPTRAPYTYESWYSPEIEELVLVKTGEDVKRLTHIVLGEPDPALFRVPADYQVVEESGPFQIIYQR